MTTSRRRCTQITVKMDTIDMRAIESRSFERNTCCVCWHECVPFVSAGHRLYIIISERVSGEPCGQCGTCTCFTFTSFAFDSPNYAVFGNLNYISHTIRWPISNQFWYTRSTRSKRRPKQIKLQRYHVQRSNIEIYFVQRRQHFLKAREHIFFIVTMWGLIARSHRFPFHLFRIRRVPDTVHSHSPNQIDTSPLRCTNLWVICRPQSMESLSPWQSVDDWQ